MYGSGCPQCLTFVQSFTKICDINDKLKWGKHMHWCIYIYIYIYIYVCVCVCVCGCGVCVCV